MVWHWVRCVSLAGLERPDTLPKVILARWAGPTQPVRGPNLGKRRFPRAEQGSASRWQHAPLSPVAAPHISNPPAPPSRLFGTHVHTRTVTHGRLSLALCLWSSDTHTEQGRRSQAGPQGSQQFPTGGRIPVAAVDALGPRPAPAPLCKGQGAAVEEGCAVLRAEGPLRRCPVRTSDGSAGWECEHGQPWSPVADAAGRAAQGVCSKIQHFNRK